jgi:hypothetical protein
MNTFSAATDVVSSACNLPKPRAVLEQHKPDVVTSIFISHFNKENFPDYPEIMFKRDFRDILSTLHPKKQQTSVGLSEEVPVDSSADAADLENSELVHKEGRKNSNHSSNIIDILEKKYCGGGYGMMDDFNDDDDEDDNHGGVGESPVSSVGGSEGKKKKRKRRKAGNKDQQGDCYDMDDSFIDDIDNITEIQSQITGKFLKTKHRLVDRCILLFLS